MSKILVFNWKMNPQTRDEANKIFESVEAATTSGLEVVVCPPYTFFPIQKKEESNYKLGSQDVYFCDFGAYTGQISASMLKEAGCTYSIIGHSETREINKLTNFDISKKLTSCLKNKITPILCIGYQKDKNSLEIDYKELEGQIVEGLQGLEGYNEEILVAYEPVWAIGTGKTATLNIVENVLGFIAKVIEENSLYNTQKIKLLYGGSVSETNIDELSQSQIIDGFLIGGASLIPEKVTKIINSQK